MAVSLIHSLCYEETHLFIARALKTVEGASGKPPAVSQAVWWKLSTVFGSWCGEFRTSEAGLDVHGSDCVWDLWLVLLF